MRAVLVALMLMLSAGTAGATAFKDGIAALEAKDFPGAIAVFGPLAAQGNGDAQFMLGVMHENGLGVPQDMGAAASWYLKAAETGVASAQYNIGVFYQLGTGVIVDPASARHWLSRAAEQGHHRAQNNLGTMYYTGGGVARDPVEALKWLTLAAEGLQGDARDIALRNIAAIEKELSAGEKAEAERRVAAWKSQR
ncbi:MAG: tetratricopeptide repeat protein [Alphaproteobacteria bacterium]